MNNKSVKDNMNIFRAFSEGMYNDNLEGLMEYIDENVEWVIMATGETFRGIDEFRQLALRSMDARKHTKETHAEFTNVFNSEDQSQMCIEYIHGAIATEKWTGSSDIRPAAGARRQVKICLVCHVKNGKWDKVHEYFDLKSVTEGPSEFRLYP